MVKEVESALKQIRPSLLSDGGDVELVSVTDGTVTVKLTGHCAGCAMSQQTLKHGIETFLKEHVPGVVSVKQTQPEPSALGISGNASFSPTCCPLQSANPQHAGPTASLRNEHDELRRRLGIFEACLARLSQTKFPKLLSADWEVVQQTARYLRNDFTRHMDFEETVLFPQVAGQISWGRPDLAMRQEHQELRRQIDNLSQAIADVDLAEPRIGEIGGRLSNALRNHIGREENVIFFEADAIMEPEALCAANH